MSKTPWIIVALVTVVVAVLAVVLVVVPAPLDQSEADPPFESENVRVSTPLPNGTVRQTFTVRGEARGPWFFEASFPIEVRDEEGNVVGSGYTMAEGEWMTEDFVPFAGEITVEEGYSGPARLVLHKHNASGLPEFTDSVEFNINVAE